MASKGLDSLAGADIPELSKGVAGARDEDVLVGRVDANAHHISEVIGEFSDLGPSLDVPEHTGHIARRGQDTTVVDEAATGEIARMAGELTSNASRPFTRRKVVDGADVIETTTGNVIAARRISARHHPRGAKRDRMDLVGRIGVPDDELAILRSGNEVSTIGGPMHGVYLRQMTLEDTARFHVNLGQGIGVALSNPADCERGESASITAIEGETDREAAGRECAEPKNLRVASVRSSFLRLILSLRPSASRLAAVILA